MAEDKADLQKTLTEYEYYKGQIEALQEGVGMIDMSIGQLESTIESLNGASALKEGNEILIPVGSESFLSAKIIDTETAIVGIGAGVAVRTGIKEAVAELDNRKKELEGIRKERSEALEKVMAAAQKMAPKLQEMISQAEKRG